MIAVILILGHLAFLAVIVLLQKRGKIKARRELYFALAMIPVAGEVCTIFLWLQHRFQKSAGRRSGELDALSADQVQESIFRPRENDAQRPAVPLEDVLILGDSGQKRSAMMDLLMDGGADPSAIRIARSSQDTEVVHYATSAMTELSRQYDLQIQRAAADYREHPESAVALDRYIDVLHNYLVDRMAEGELLEIQRLQYQKLLQERIRRISVRMENHQGNRDNRQYDGESHKESHADDYAEWRQRDLADLAESYLNGGNMAAADSTISLLEQEKRKWGRTLDLRLRYYYETRQGDKIQELIRSLRQEDFLPEAVQELARFWEIQSKS